MFQLPATFLLFIIYINIGFSQQNLVPNPSFEVHDSCPYIYYGQVNLSEEWSSFRESPDYGNTCAGTVPTSPIGSTQNPVTGNAYCGFIAYGASQNGNYREHLGAQLCQNLVIGQQYFVSMNIIRSSGYPGACNNIGIKFSTVPFTSVNFPPLSNNAHVFSNTVISNDSIWTYISGTFVPDSSYSYIMIGNFFDSTNTVQYGSGAYYFVDDICVSTDPLGCGMQSCASLDITPTKFLNSMTISPNPVIDKMNINFNNAPNEIITLIIYDSFGRFQKSIDNISTTETIDVELGSNLSKGVYFVQLLKNDQIIATSKFLKN